MNWSYSDGDGIKFSLGWICSLSWVYLRTPFLSGPSSPLNGEQISVDPVEAVGWRVLWRTSVQVEVSQYNFLTALHMDAAACPYLYLQRWDTAQLPAVLDGSSARSKVVEEVR